MKRGSVVVPMLFLGIGGGGSAGVLRGRGRACSPRCGKGEGRRFERLAHCCCGGPSTSMTMQSSGMAAALRQDANVTLRSHFGSFMPPVQFVPESRGWHLAIRHTLTHIQHLESGHVDPAQLWACSSGDRHRGRRRRWGSHANASAWDCHRCVCHVRITFHTQRKTWKPHSLLHQANSWLVKHCNLLVATHVVMQQYGRACQV
jgi:hypothetical protein